MENEESVDNSVNDSADSSIGADSIADSADSSTDNSADSSASNNSGSSRTKSKVSTAISSAGADGVVGIVGLVCIGIGSFYMYVFNNLDTGSKLVTIGVGIVLIYTAIKTIGEGKHIPKIGRRGQTQTDTDDES